MTLIAANHEGLLFAARGVDDRWASLSIKANGMDLSRLAQWRRQHLRRKVDQGLDHASAADLEAADPEDAAPAFKRPP